MINSETFLLDNAQKIGVTLDSRQLSKFLKYKKMILETNKNINLTAITNDSDIIIKHFVDSLSIVPLIDKKASVIDIGTGAGLPGIPLKIALPHINITLVDSLNKRIMFLNEVIATLGLNNINAIHTRAEDLGNSFKKTYDIATSRAVASLSLLSELSLPYLRIGGKLLAFKGSNYDDELTKAKDTITVLGGTVSAIKQITLPTTNIVHNIIVIDKIQETPPKYPRKANQMKKSITMS